MIYRLILFCLALVVSACGTAGSSGTTHQAAQEAPTHEAAVSLETLNEQAKETIASFEALPGVLAPPRQPDPSTVPSTSPRVARKAAPPRSTTTKPAEPATRPSGGTAGARRVTSTAYCLTGTTANGGRGHAGSVAMNGVPFGSRWRVVETGQVYVVNDRIGHGSQFDIWMGSCSAARSYGRRTIHIVRA